MVFFSGEVLLRVASFFLPPGSASKKARKSSVCSELYPDPGKAERREQELWDNSQPQDTLWLCRALGCSSVTQGRKGLENHYMATKSTNDLFLHRALGSRVVCGDRDGHRPTGKWKIPTQRTLETENFCLLTQPSHGLEGP